MPTKKEYVEAVTEARGLISVAARRLGVTRKAVYEARDRYPDVSTALNVARERTTDLAEGKLYEQIAAGNMTAIIFYLKCQAKNRGYIEKSEIHHTGNDRIVVNLVDD